MIPTPNERLRKKALETAEQIWNNGELSKEDCIEALAAALESVRREAWEKCRNAIKGMSKADYYLADREQVLEALLQAARLEGIEIKE